MGMQHTLQRVAAGVLRALGDMRILPADRACGFGTRGENGRSLCQIGRGRKWPIATCGAVIYRVGKVPVERLENWEVGDADAAPATVMKHKA